MARRHDLVGLTVLAILSVRASHPYELHRFIIDTHKDYVTGLPRSLYHAVERLARDELITPTKTDREGRRPERTVYEITDEGRRELSTRLRRLLEEPEPDRRTLVAAISLIGVLPTEAAIKSLRLRVAALTGAIGGLDAQMATMAENGLPRLLMLELECERALFAAEQDWVREVLGRMESGELDWPATVKQSLMERALEE
ncbi:PadR family transcriptional regulator [Nonomuraea glycinis]|uniref:PadR family transcriptional regulator n=1 Tax=Nonomuraea glycinis TaxID=2047744 RepID=A0A918A1L4_9ACTN|nr:PadR family transcriptional regulator [Nonomuraea glycinis]MCA2176766.1 PadR family transcriptional regulator [Nonomuraea glycinis]WSG70279.1 PadR family transcriptional regulator [Nonomuraea glycinis]GGP03353.1 PadR family transcriptional regulator [Nonomuraea glycinis]